MIKFFAVFFGGGLGALLRYFAGVLVKRFSFLNGFAPVFGTFFVNIFGCFLLGAVFGLCLNKLNDMPEALKLFITVGFLGGLTTFSTFNLEIFEFLRQGKIFHGVFYMILSLSFGLLFTYLGYLFSNMLKI